MPELIGISAVTPVFDSVIQLTKKLKIRLPKTKIMIGGRILLRYQKEHYMKLGLISLLLERVKSNSLISLEN